MSAPCPVCENDAPRTMLARTAIVYGSASDLVECANCGVLCFDPLPSDADLARFYAGGYYDFDRDKEEGKGMAFARRLRRLKRGGRFLDVGCATGFFINGIRQHSDWQVYGTDVGASAVRFARGELGLDVRQGELTDAGFPDAYFDYVHVNNVLEHVRDPVALLAACRRVIKPDGVFLLSVPNGYADSRDLINFWREVGLPARSRSGHIFFFPARTLLPLLERQGFAVESMRTYGWRRALRSLGYLPRKRDWRQSFHPPTAPETVAETVTIPTGKTRSTFHHRFRYLRGQLQMIPGLHAFGLDFMFTARPRRRV